MLEQRRAALRAEARKIVEHALADFFRAEIGVVGVGETVGLVAQALEELQAGVGRARNSEGYRTSAATSFRILTCWSAWSIQ
jgi:predicted TIM-barrel enzyme